MSAAARRLMCVCKNAFFLTCRIHRRLSTRRRPNETPDEGRDVSSARHLSLPLRLLYAVLTFELAGLGIRYMIGDKMQALTGILLLSGVQLARAHGGHTGHDRVAGETIQQYAQRHVCY